ncbi:MAG: SDR family oxidoreductase [Dehalococcoidia bacterium]
MAPRLVRDTVVVITGATSGIGRETAREFAAAGANVVVAARRQDRLNDLVAEITKNGGDALAVPTDVAVEQQVSDMIAAARSHYGRIDTLVNNAGIGIAARFRNQSLADFRRIIDVNFWGAVYACHAVLPLMQEQESGGLIVNVSSILGKRAMPFQTAYSASKFALAGFSEALRAEVMTQGIDVTTVFPGAVDTEIFDTAQNNTGFEMPDFLPKLPAGVLARAIVANAYLPQPEIIMAADAQGLDLMNTVAPRLLDAAMGQAMPFIEGLRKGMSQARSEEDRPEPGPDAA